MREAGWGTKWTLHELDFGHIFGFGFALDWRSELRLAAGVTAFVRTAGFELRSGFTLLCEDGGGLGDDGGGLEIMLVRLMIGV